MSDQLRFIGDELHEQLRLHHRSAGRGEPRFSGAMQSQLLVPADGLQAEMLAAPDWLGTSAADAAVGDLI